MALCWRQDFIIDILHRLCHILLDRHICASHVCRVLTHRNPQQNLNRKANIEVHKGDLGSVVSRGCTVDYYQLVLLDAHLCGVL